MTLATNLLAMGGQIAGALPPKWGMPLQTAVNIGYVLSRGLAKQGVSPQ